MAQLIDLGKLRFNFTGDYDNSETYEYNDVVAYGANSYVYINSVASSGNLPTDEDFWAIIVTGVQFEGDWNDTTEYQKNDIVKYGPKTYIALQDSVDIIPDNVTYWSLLNDGLGFVGDWETATVYFAGDVVNRGGLQYVALVHHTSDDFLTDLGDEKWEAFLEGFRFRGEWEADTEYLKNDIVLDLLNSYIATTDFTSNSVDFDSETPGNWLLFTPGTDVLPSQLDKANYVLSTDGTDPFWTADINIDGAIIGQQLLVGPGAPAFEEDGELTNAIAVFNFDNGQSDESFAQVGFRNADDTSSTDIIAYSADGNDTYGWISMGVTGKNFGDPEFTLTAGNTAYIFYEAEENAADVDGTGDLVLATGDKGLRNAIVFAAGGFATGTEQMTIVPGETVHIEIDTESESATTGALTVAGGIGTQGNINVLGNLNVNGSVNVSGGSFSTETLISTTPIFNTGEGATNNNVDRGFVVEYKSPTSPSSFGIGTVEAGSTEGVGVITRKGYTTLTKSIATNVATVQVQEASHSILEGETVVIANLGSPWDGTHTVTAVTTTTFSYAAIGSNTAPTADTDGTVAVNIPTTFVNGDSIVIADCNISAFNGQRNFVRTVSGNTITFDFTGTQALTTASAGTVTVNSKTKFAGFVRDNSNSKWSFLDKIPTVNVGGVNVAPTTDIDFGDPNLETPTLRLGGLEFIGTPTIAGNPTFSGNVTFTNLVGNPTFTGNPTFSGSPIFSGQPTFTGGIRVQEMVEDIVDVSPTTNTYTLDYTTGNIFYSTGSLSANFTVNMTNVPTTSGRVFTVNLIVTQGATGYRPGTLNINGSGVTIKWAGGAVPTPTSSSGKLDIFTYTIIRRGSAFEALVSANLNF